MVNRRKFDRVGQKIYNVTSANDKKKKKNCSILYSVNVKK